MASHGVTQTDLSREPCPDRIVEDLGGAFGMGCVGGFLWHSAKGWYHSPKGSRIQSALYRGRLSAGTLGGNFAIWGGTFSVFDCTFQHLRKKDDHWNAIASGATTGGLLALRGGWRSASRQAALGAVLLAVIEGVMVVFSRTSKSTPRDQYYQAMEMERAQEKKKAAAAAQAAAVSSGGAARPGFALPQWLSRSTEGTPASEGPSSGRETFLNDAGNTLESSGRLHSSGGSSGGNGNSFSPFTSEYSSAAETVAASSPKRWRLFA